MKSEEIEQFIELADKATRAPWCATISHSNYVVVLDVLGSGTKREWTTEFNDEQDKDDSLFIAKSRAIAPGLAKEVLLLREKLAVAVEALKFVNDTQIWAHVMMNPDVALNVYLEAAKTAKEAIEKIGEK